MAVLNSFDSCLKLNGIIDNTPKMEKKLHAIKERRKLQDRVITLRADVPPEYKEYLQKETIASLTNLLNATVDVEKISLPVTNVEKTDTSCLILNTNSVQQCNQRCKDVLTCLSFLQR